MQTLGLILICFLVAQVSNLNINSWITFCYFTKSQMWVILQKLDPMAIIINDDQSTESITGCFQFFYKICRIYLFSSKYSQNFYADFIRYLQLEEKILGFIYFLVQYGFTSNLSLSYISSFCIPLCDTMNLQFIF